MAKTSTSRLFTGFSTAIDQAGGPRDWVLYDIDLVNRDLLNHFNTRKGERVMRPDWGCALWDWIMEPLTASMRDSVVAECERICNADGRLVMNSCVVVDINNGFQVSMELFYVPLGVVKTFRTTFENNQNQF